MFIQAEAGALIGLNRLAEIDGVPMRVEASARVLRAYTPGRLMLYSARELRAHGHRAESVAMGERALKFFSGPAGGPSPTVAHRAELAAALVVPRRNGSKRARRHLRRTGVGSAEVAGIPGVVRRSFRPRQHKTADARRSADALAQLTRPYLLGEHRSERARVLAALGDFETALAALNQSFAGGQFWTNGKIHRDPAFEAMLGYPPFQAFLK